MVGETWRICLKVFRDFSLAPTPSSLSPIVGIPAFSPGLHDSRFQELKVVRRSQARHFIANGQWMTRQRIIDDPALAGLSF